MSSDKGLKASDVVVGGALAASMVVTGVASGGALVPVVASAAVGLGILKAGDAIAGSIDQKEDSGVVEYHELLLKKECNKLGIETKDLSADEIADNVFELLTESIYSFPDEMTRPVRAYVALVGAKVTASIKFLTDDEICKDV